MHWLHTVALAASFTSLLGCRTNPCGDDHGALPASLTPVGVALDDTKVCRASAEEATMMFWGGREKLDAVAARLLVSMASQGWTQPPPNPYTVRDPQSPAYVFQRGDDLLTLRFRMSRTPRLGSKLLTDTVTVTAYHDVARRRAHP